MQFTLLVCLAVLALVGCASSQEQQQGLQPHSGPEKVIPTSQFSDCYNRGTLQQDEAQNEKGKPVCTA